MARSPLDHEHGGLYGVGAEPVQGQSDRQRAVRAYDDGRGRGLGAPCVSKYSGRVVQRAISCDPSAAARGGRNEGCRWRRKRLTSLRCIPVKRVIRLSVCRFSATGNSFTATSTYTPRSRLETAGNGIERAIKRRTNGRKIRRSASTSRFGTFVGAEISLIATIA